MHEPAGAARSIVQLPGMSLGVVEQLMHRLDRQRSLYDHRLRNRADNADRPEILDRIVLDRLRCRRDRHGADAADAERVAVANRLRDIAHTDSSAAARAVIDDDGLAERPFHVARRETPDEIGIAARRIGDDEGDGLPGPTVLGECRRRSRQHPGRQQQGHGFEHLGLLQPKQADISTRRFRIYAASSGLSRNFWISTSRSAENSWPSTATGANSTRLNLAFCSTGTVASIPSLARIPLFPARTYS